MSRFDGENRRDVVDDVKSASSDVDTARAGLEGAAGDLDTGTSPLENGAVQHKGDLGPDGSKFG